MSKLQTWNTQTLNSLGEYLDKHFEKLDEVVSAIQDISQDERYERKKGSLALDGTGAGLVTLNVTLGFDWILERVTIAAGPAGQVTFFENSTAPSDTLETITLNAQGVYSDAFNNNIFVPSGSSLLIQFVGAGANGQGAYNLQIKRLMQRQPKIRPEATYTGGYS